MEGSDQSTDDLGEESGEESIPTDDSCDENVLPEANPKSIPMERVTQLELPKVIVIHC